MASRILTSNIGVPTPVAGAAIVENSANAFVLQVAGVSAIGTTAGLSMAGGGARVTLNGTLAAAQGPAFLIGSTLPASNGNTVTLGETGLLAGFSNGMLIRSGQNNVVIEGSVTAGGAGIVLGTAGVGSTRDNALTLAEGASVTAGGSGIVDQGGRANLVLNGQVHSAGLAVALDEFSFLTQGAGGVLSGTTGIVAADGAATITLHGTIATTSDGIVLGSLGRAVINSFVTIAEGASVTSELGGVIDRSGEVNLVVAGTVSAESVGVDLRDGAEVTIGATGIVRGTQALRALEDGNVVSNAGLIHGSSTGVTALAGLNLTNTGTIAARTAVQILGRNEEAALHNSGTIAGNVTLRTGQIELHNSGEILGSTGLDSGATHVANHGILNGGTDAALSVGDFARVFNSGDIIGQQGGLIFGSNVNLINRGFIFSLEQQDAATGRVVIANHGVIGTVDGDAIALEGGSATEVALLTNFADGVISGTVSTGDNPCFLRNKGLIEGRVQMGDLADIYDGRGGVLVAGLFAGGGNDTLLGGAQDEVFVGGAGSDSLRAQNGEDMIIAEANDGDDDYDGGAGLDTLILTTATLAVQVDLAAERSVSAEFGTDRVANIEHVSSGAGNDRLTGDEAANLLEGGGGADKLLGNDGRDSLQGGAGADDLTGGAGRDVLTGGAGADRFIFAKLTDSTVSAPDVITDFIDFTSGLPERDRIHLAAIDAKANVAGDQAFVSIAGAEFVNGSSAGKLRFEQVGGNTLIEMEVNNDGLADMAILLHGLHTITSSDYIL